MAIMAEQWGRGAMPGMMPSMGGMPGPGGMMASGPGMGMANAMGGGCSPFNSNMSQGSTLSMDLKRLFLDLSPEEQKQYRASELLMRSSPSDVAACIPVILNKLVNFPSAHSLGIHALGELFRVQPGALAQQVGPNQIYDLFNPSVDDGPAGSFLYGLLCWKSANGGAVFQEAGKIQRLLMRRCKTQDLRRVQGSPLRYWLCKIWLDLPSTRPERQVLTQCCARWMGDARTSLADKLPCMGLLKEEIDTRSPSEADIMLVSLLLEQVCRDPVSHSPDLQQLLWLLTDVPSATALKTILSGLAEEPGRLVTLWICLSLWVPQQGPSFMPPRSPSPTHVFLCSILMSFSQLANGNEICRTCVLSLAGVAASGNGASSQLAASATDLLLLLHRDGPLLSSDAWWPLTPIIQNLAYNFESAAKLLQRLGELSGAAPADFGNQASAFGTNQPMGMQGQMSGLGTNQPMGMQGQMSALGANQSMGMQGQWNGNTDGAMVGNYQQAPQAPQQVQAPAWNGNPAPEPPPEPGKISYPWTPPRVGLQNINNTCYMNTVIQSLFMTNSFIHDLYNFKLTLKKNPSVVDKEDHEMGKKILKMMQRHMAKMILTRHPHTDIAQLLSVFPETYRNGEQQDVSECVRWVLDKLGSFEQPLIRDSFAGAMNESTQCQICGNIRSRPESFTDQVLSVPPEQVVKQSGQIPTCQMLFNQRLQAQMLSDDNLLQCERCQTKTKAMQWTEITSPPRHLCICLNLFSFNVQQGAVTKEKTPVNIAGPLQIGPYQYELYFVIVHTGKDATSGHYYAIGSRAEITQQEMSMGQKQWFSMDDSQLKPADQSTLAILHGTSDKKDDQPYVLFYRCQQAPPTPQVRLPQKLADDVQQEDAKIVIS